MTRALGKTCPAQRRLAGLTWSGYGHERGFGLEQVEIKMPSDVAPRSCLGILAENYVQNASSIYNLHGNTGEIWCRLKVLLASHARFSNCIRVQQIIPASRSVSTPDARVSRYSVFHLQKTAPKSPAPPPPAPPVPSTEPATSKLLETQSRLTSPCKGNLRYGPIRPMSQR